jgi:branched-subunit amino acid transport protein
VKTWVAIVLIGVGSYAFRVVPVLAAGRMRPRPRLERALGHVPPAVLSALAVTAAIRHDGGGRPGAGVAVVVALAVGVAVSARRLPMIAALAGGLAAYWSVVVVAGGGLG